MICRSAKDHRADWVVILDGIVKTFDYDGADALASAIAIRGVVKCLAIARPRKKVASVQAGGEVRVSQDVRSPCDGSVDFSPPQGIARKVYAGQARRARCVDCIARATELEVVIDAPWYECTIAAGCMPFVSRQRN